MQSASWIYRSRDLARLPGSALLILLSLPESVAQSEDVHLVAPDGFVVETFAHDLDGPRWMAFGPDGNLYVTLSEVGQVVRLEDRDGDGMADEVTTIIAGLNRPHGLAWHEGDLWIAETTRVIRLEGGDSPVGQSELTVVVDGLPEGGHVTRTILFVPFFSGFLLSIGSSCDVCKEEDPRRASILHYNLDGSDRKVVASGLRDAVGLAVNPETGELWATEIGRDWLGDDLPPEELNSVRLGRNYGWPYCYGDRIPNPEFADRARCDGTEPPILTFTAHSTPLGIAFYDASMFPPEYKGDAFVALHGSLNRSVRSGYKVVRVRVGAGRPQRVEDFVTGWLGVGDEVRGRPVQPLVGPDGALYVSDDFAGRIWRVVYRAGSSEPVASPGLR